MASLLVVTGPSHGDFHPLGDQIVVIGQDPGCQIPIADTLVSPQHVQIRSDQADDARYALDMGSAGGTFINGRQITAETLLKERDILKVGVSEIIFSTLDFADSDAAFRHYGQPQARGRGTASQHATFGAVDPDDLDVDDHHSGSHNKPRKSGR